MRALEHSCPCLRRRAAAVTEREAVALALAAAMAIYLASWVVEQPAAAECSLVSSLVSCRVDGTSG
jgi:hypothetical protein